MSRNLWTDLEKLAKMSRKPVAVNPKSIGISTYITNQSTPMAKVHEIVYNNTTLNGESRCVIIIDHMIKTLFEGDHGDSFWKPFSEQFEIVTGIDFILMCSFVIMITKEDWAGNGRELNSLETIIFIMVTMSIGENREEIGIENEPIETLEIEEVECDKEIEMEVDHKKTEVNLEIVDIKHHETKIDIEEEETVTL